MSEDDIVAACVGAYITNDPSIINLALDEGRPVMWLSRKVVNAFIDACQNPNQELFGVATGPALKLVVK